jgi:hypothetical protein
MTDSEGAGFTPWETIRLTRPGAWLRIGTEVASAAVIGSNAATMTSALTAQRPGQLSFAGTRR